MIFQILFPYSEVLSEETKENYLQILKEVTLEYISNIYIFIEYQTITNTHDKIKIERLLTLMVK